jgi:hypothetical protein
LAIPSKKNTTALLDNIRDIFRSNKQATAG